MHTYTLSELRIGQTESFDVSITQHMIDAFYEVTGDENPLHRDPQHAAEWGFSSCVSYGLLTASFLSTLAGVYLPGKYCVLHGVEIEFVKPVFEGDELHIEGTVDQISEAVRRIVVRTVITNQRGEKVLRGKTKAGVLK